MMLVLKKYFLCKLSNYRVKYLGSQIAFPHFFSWGFDLTSQFIGVTLITIFNSTFNIQ